MLHPKVLSLVPLRNTVVWIMRINQPVTSIQGWQVSDRLTQTDEGGFAFRTMSRRRMKGTQFFRIERFGSSMFLGDGRNPASYGDQTRTMVRDSIGAKVEDVRTDRIPERMKTAGQTIENVFRLILLVSNDRVFHSPDVLKNEPIRLQLLENAYTRKNQTVALVLLRTFALADGCRNTTCSVGGHSLARW